MSKPKIDPAAGWGIVVSPQQVGDTICVTAALKDPQDRVVAQVVADVVEVGFRQATLDASNLLKEMMRLGGGASDGESKPEPKSPPKPKLQPQASTFELEPESIQPLAGKGEILSPNRIFDDRSELRKEEGEDSSRPLQSDLQALNDACEAEGVPYPDADNLPATRREAADWILGLREGRYSSLPPVAKNKEVGNEQG